MNVDMNGHEEREALLNMHKKSIMAQDVYDVGSVWWCFTGHLKSLRHYT